MCAGCLARWPGGRRLPEVAGRLVGATGRTMPTCRRTAAVPHGSTQNRRWRWVQDLHAETIFSPVGLKASNQVADGAYK